MATPAINTNVGFITAQGLGNVGDVIVNSHNIIYKGEPAKRKLELANWVSDLDFSEYHKEALDKYTEGTLSWALQESEFDTWSRQGGMLWGHGKPGAGKTTFASFVINHFERLGETWKPEDPTPPIVCYVYCQSAKIRKPVQLLAAILKQLILRCKTMNVDDLLDLKDEGRPLTPADIFSRLKDTFKRVQNVFVIIDGLDECIGESTRSRIVEDLQSFTLVKVLITSRFLLSIQYAVATARARTLMIDARPDDVRTHFRHEAHWNTTLGRLLSNLSKTKIKEIEDKIIEKADGMFFFAACLIDKLIEETKPNKLLKALDTVPRKALVLYEQILKQIREQDPSWQELALHTFSWILEALRPLKMIEIRHALAIGSLHLDQMAEENDLDDEVAIISSCAGLINIDTKGVCFFHHTVQEFLQDARTADHFLPEMVVATTTLKIISFPGIECDPPYPLAEYAAFAWGPLVQRHESDDAVCNLAVSQLADAIIVSILSRTCTGSAFSDYEGRCGAIAMHIIVAYGLVRTGGRFITMGCISKKDDYGRVALICAGSNGGLELVKQLFRHTSIEVRDQYDLTSLLTAVEEGSHTCGQGKRPRGVSINTTRSAATTVSVRIP